jgi:hypothetical protein
MSLPSIKIQPDAGSKNLVTKFKSVLFPDPECPTRAIVFPAGIVIDKLLKIGKVPSYEKHRSLIKISPVISLSSIASVLSMILGLTSKKLKILSLAANPPEADRQINKLF